MLNRRSPLFLKGKYIGLLVTAVRVSDLSRFLDRLDSTSPTDKSFLLYGPDLVLAHSNMSSGTYQRAESRALPRRDQVADLVLSNL